jgi:uncharacterized protein YaiE (UPF0345 family)
MSSSNCYPVRHGDEVASSNFPLSDNLPASVSLMKLSKSNYGTCIRSKLEKLDGSLKLELGMKARCQDKASCWTRGGGQSWG